MNTFKTRKIWGTAAALGLLLSVGAWAAPALMLGKTKVEAEGTNADGGILALEVEEEIDDGQTSITGGLTYFFADTVNSVSGDADAVVVVGNTAYVSGIVTSSTFPVVGNSFAIKLYENDGEPDQMGALFLFLDYFPMVAQDPGFRDFYDNSYLPFVGGPRDFVDGTVKIQVE